MEKISSEQNIWVKKIKALKKRKYREEYQQFIVEGIRFCHEAFLHNTSIEAILVSENAAQLPAFQELLDKFDGKVLQFEGNLLEKNLSTVNPQGIAAIVNMPNWKLEDTLKTGTTFLILDGIQDPGNLGTLVRTSLAAGVDAVFCLKGTVDIYNDKSLRSTMGAVFKLPIYYFDNHHLLLEKLKEQEIKLVLADIKASKYHFQVQYPFKIALVLGSEAVGLKQIIQGDYLVKIPLKPESESLNVAVAGAIIIYEIIRQRITTKNAIG